MTQVLFDAAEAIRIAAVLLLPVMPASAAEILRRVGETTAATDLRLDRRALACTTASACWSKGDALWPRVDAAGTTSKPVDTRLATEEEHTGGRDQSAVRRRGAGGHPPAAGDCRAAAPAAPTAATADDSGRPERISIDDFMKVELRVAKVLAAEKVPKSKKLMKLTVDVGTEQRTLVAGIAEAYEPEALVGRTIVIVFNLKPAKLMGIESNGMVLAASPEGGKPTLVGFDRTSPPGSRVR